MRYDIDVIRKAEIELLAQMQGATSITKKKSHMFLETGHISLILNLANS